MLRDVFRTQDQDLGCARCLELEVVLHEIAIEHAEHGGTGEAGQGIRTTSVGGLELGLSGGEIAMSLPVFETAKDAG